MTDLEEKLAARQREGVITAVGMVALLGGAREGLSSRGPNEETGARQS
jgi:hypothetical protein